MTKHLAHLDRLRTIRSRLYPMWKTYEELLEIERQLENEK